MNAIQIRTCKKCGKIREFRLPFCCGDDGCTWACGKCRKTYGNKWAADACCEVETK